MTNLTNPFQPPQAHDRGQDVRTRLIDQLDLRTVKQLRRYHSIITAMAFLWCFGCVLCTSLAIIFTDQYDYDNNPQYSWVSRRLQVAAVIGASCFMLGAIGTFLRTRWGRLASLVLAAFICLYVPIGTATGIVGLVACIKGKKLFGPDRIRGADLHSRYQELRTE